MNDTPCQCAYCQEGMSKSGAECVDRMVAVTKSLRESAKKLYSQKEETK